MKLDLSKLKHVEHKADGKITAQCPACAAKGGDAKGDHLVVFRDGKFGCVLHEKDKAHNRVILKLVGLDDRGDSSSSCRLTVTPMRVADSTVLMKVGRLGRVKPSPTTNEGDAKPHPEAGDGPQEPTESRPYPPADAAGSEQWVDGMEEDLQRFLAESVN